jgi:serine/threonine protein kinase
MSSIRVNVSWAPPEVFFDDPYLPQSDVYSFGIILWELYTRQRPFHELEELLIVPKIVRIL